jgi:hypothetical protein
MKQNRVSNYLVSDIKWVENSEPHEGFYEPYPDGGELDELENLFDSVIDAFKVLYKIPNFTPFNTVREDEYFEMKKTSKTSKSTTDEGMVVEKTKSGKKVEFIDSDKDHEIIQGLRILEKYTDDSLDKEISRVKELLDS